MSKSNGSFAQPSRLQRARALVRRAWLLYCLELVEAELSGIDREAADLGQQLRRAMVKRAELRDQLSRS